MTAKDPKIARANFNLQRFRNARLPRKGQLSEKALADFKRPAYTVAGKEKNNEY